jgi:tRNA (guanine37-N1)-methyltransferase
MDILTLFPQAFEGVLGNSILKIAQEKGLVEFHLTDIRDFATDKHRTVDDRPFGGGPGMVMKCEPLFACYEHVKAAAAGLARTLLLTPQGRVFDQALAWELSRQPRLILVCGRYEGFDERIRIGLDAEEISIGNYVLSGGEVAAMVIIEAVTRLIPGVLGKEESARFESFEEGLLDFPQYTRPREFRGMTVPEVLLSGDHEKIRRWRQQQARERTVRRNTLMKEVNQ